MAGRRWFGITLMMEAVQTSETLVNSYQPTWCYNPEDSHLHTQHCESLKSETLKLVYFAYFHSITSYWVIFWKNSTDSKKVFYLQKKIIRIMAGTKRRVGNSLRSSIFFHYPANSCSHYHLSWTIQKNSKQKSNNHNTSIRYRYNLQVLNTNLNKYKKEVYSIEELTLTKNSQLL
jgi:hypothetical protein